MEDIKVNKMNGYVCIWNGEANEVHAKSSYEAQQIAEKEFQKKTRKKVKGYQITVVLAEKDGEQVVHSTSSI